VADAPPVFSALSVAAPPMDDTNAEGTVVDIQRTRRDRSAGRRWVVTAAAVVAVMLLIAGVVLVQQTGDDHIRTKPAAPGPAPTTLTPPTTLLTPPTTTPGDDSTTGPLLPEGTPSTPRTGELVAAVGLFHGGAYDLYADGRLIWHDGSGEWVEQRLTPDGVERVRSEFLSSGLFDAAQPPSDLPPCTDRFRMCVRDDAGRLLSLAPPKSESEPPPPEASELLAHLMNLESSLPATEWADRAIKPYVPSRIAVCLRMYDNKVEVPLDLSTLLPLLPARAAELLGGREASSELLTSTFGDPASWGSCFDMTLDEARTLADALLSPSGGGAHEYWGILLGFDYQPDPAQPDATVPDAAYVGFQQLLPDGLWSSVPG
jgi:hypothetical protein